MAIVKATYTKNKQSAKKSIRYIQHRPGKDGAKIERALFGSDGVMQRFEALRMIDQAEKGSAFFRIVISPDPAGEDGKNDLNLREVAERTMQMLNRNLKKQVLWTAAVHADHTPHRHVHVVAVVSSRLKTRHFQTLRQEATAACRDQRRKLDHILRQEELAREEAEWGRGL